MLFWVMVFIITTENQTWTDPQALNNTVSQCPPEQGHIGWRYWVKPFRVWALSPFVSSPSTYKGALGIREAIYARELWLSWDGLEFGWVVLTQLPQVYTEMCRRLSPGERAFCVPAPGSAFGSRLLVTLHALFLSPSVYACGHTEFGTLLLPRRLQRDGGKVAMNKAFCNES